MYSQIKLGRALKSESTWFFLISTAAGSGLTARRCGMPIGSVSELIRRMQDGDSSAVRGIWSRYFPRLIALARATLNGRPRRVSDEEDAAISAFASFWERADKGEFAKLTNRKSLWALLAVLTIRKALKQARDESRQKRGGGNVVTESDITHWMEGQRPTSPLTEAAASLSPEEFDFQASDLIKGLPSPQLRSIAILRMMDHTVMEIANKMELSDGQVRRKLRVIRTLLRDSRSES